VKATSDPAADPAGTDLPAAARPPRPEHHHRDIRGGVARAAVFGVSDGLVTNVSLILGVAGAHPSPSFVRLAGLAGLVAGAISMAAGEYISMKAQRELLERELAIERRELARRPHVEKVELIGIYQSRGIDPDTARELADTLMRDPDVALATHAREELGIEPNALGSPVGAAVSSLITFAIGAFVPLLPWLFTHGTTAVLTSIILAAFAAVAVGIALARFTDRNPTRSALRQLAIATIAALATYGIGSLVGVNV
jgi:VIT1/CCC1 family predicted Fe2+/Mn2+ transporter